MAVAIRILGLDPGLGRMGWGIIDMSGTRLTHVAHGVFTSSAKLELAARLMALHGKIAAVISEHRPTAISVEQAFVAKDPSAALKLGHARAIALLAAAQAGLDIAEYAPNHIKKCVVGVGHAEKAQVLHMVKILLPQCGEPAPDEADALAVAICHAHMSVARSLQLKATAQ